MQNDFPDHTVEVDDKSFLCGSDNEHKVVLLRLRLSPKKEKSKGSSSSTKLERMLECSGHLPSYVHFEMCSYYTAQGAVVRPTSTVDTNLIAVLVTVFAVVAVLLLAVLMYWKRQKVTAFAKHWAAQCR